MVEIRQSQDQMKDLETKLQRESNISVRCDSSNKKNNKSSLLVTISSKVLKSRMMHILLFCNLIYY